MTYAWIIESEEPDDYGTLWVPFELASSKKAGEAKIAKLGESGNYRLKRYLSGGEK